MPRRTGKGRRRTLTQVIREPGTVSAAGIEILLNTTEPPGENLRNLRKGDSVSVTFRDGSRLVYAARRAFPDSGPRMRIVKAELSDELAESLASQGFRVSIEKKEASRLTACERQEVHSVSDYVNRREDWIIPDRHLIQWIRRSDGVEVEVKIEEPVISVEVDRPARTGGSAA